MSNPVYLQGPKNVVLITSQGQGNSELNAFDAALVSGGIGDISLIKVTSILPQDIQFTTEPKFAFGMSIPAIYTTSIAKEIDETISAAIGYVRTKNGPTLVAESSGKTEQAIQEQLVEKYLNEMMKIRSLKMGENPVIEGIQAQVVPYTCVFAGIVYQK